MIQIQDGAALVYDSGFIDVLKNGVHLVTLQITQLQMALQVLDVGWSSSG